MGRRQCHRCDPVPWLSDDVGRAGTEELITAELDFTAIASWYDVLPWREWLAGPQREISRLIVDELSALSMSTAQ